MKSVHNAPSGYGTRQPRTHLDHLHRPRCQFADLEGESIQGAWAIDPAVQVFVFDVIDKKSTRRATRLLITEYLALDLSVLVHQARELGMYVALHTPAVHTKVSRSDRYLSDGAMALELPTIERHADSLARLPSELTNAVALCMAHIRDLQEQVYLLTSDEPLGRHYPSASEGRDRTNRAAAALMKAAERALEVADRVRVTRGD